MSLCCTKCDSASRYVIQGMYKKQHALSLSSQQQLTPVRLNLPHSAPAHSRLVELDPLIDSHRSTEKDAPHSAPAHSRLVELDPLIEDQRGTKRPH